MFYLLKLPELSAFKLWIAKDGVIFYIKNKKIDEPVGHSIFKMIHDAECRL